jgi:sucrose-6-phosphate hydrolase SacC (GH32 family)
MTTETQTTLVNPVVQSPVKKFKNPLLIVIAIIVIAVLIGLAFVLTRAKNPSVSQSPLESNSNTQINQPSENSTSAKMKVQVIEEGKLALPKGHADPSVVETATGYRMYVNRQSGGPNGIMIYKSTDGVTWEKESDIVIPGAATNRAVVLPDGVRIYYPQSQPIRPTDPTANMLSSFSNDGLNFNEDPEIVLAPRSSEYYVEGPTVFQLSDNTWRMYFNENSVAAAMQRDGEIWGASSSDGVTWVRDTSSTLVSDIEGGPWKQVLHPFVLKNPVGGYIMFYNSHSEIFAATSNDGLTWEKLGEIGIHGADVDGYFIDENTIRVYYGDFNPTDGGLVYTAVLEVQ